MEICTVLLEDAYGNRQRPFQGTHRQCVFYLETHIDTVDAFVGNKTLDGVHILYPSGRAASFVLFNDSRHTSY